MATLGRWIRGFGAFWWDFIVGDDWHVAAGVVVALAVTAGLAWAGWPAWWFLPIAVLLLLAFSLRRTARSRGNR
jgi:hypothetical protein